MRVHLIGLPHTQTTADYEPCAFTQKLQVMAVTLEQLGHEPVIYSGEANDAPGEHVVVATDADKRRWFGVETWRDRVFDRWDVDTDPAWLEFNEACVKAVAERAGPRDVVSLTMGRAHAAVARALPHLLAVELGVGYEGTLNGHRVFESNAWRHFIYGRDGVNDGRFYDATIPQGYDPTRFGFRAHHDGYLLFLGRHIPRKGLAIVAELAKRHRVVTAGQLGEKVPGAEYVGVVRGKDKADLLAGAKALLAPTQYIEPGGGVALEAQLSGVPVISTDFGCFTETVLPGDGYRCSTLAEFHRAAHDVEQLDRAAIRHRAHHRWTIDAVAPRYDDYLHRLEGLWGDGWYSEEAAA